MNVEEVKKLPPLERFLFWVRERNQIRLKRLAGLPKPWTDNEILRDNYFTNVQREHDRVTIWFKDNVRERLRDSPGVVFATVAFRWFNLPTPTGEYLNSHGYLEDWNMQKAIAGILEFQSRGLKVFTGAFNISNSGSTKPKVNRVCEDYIQPVWERGEALSSTLQRLSTMDAAFKVLSQLPGLGGSGFMAAQVVCDLAYTHVLQDAPDWWTWCSWGPGSKRGMNRVFGYDEDYAMPKQVWHQKLEGLRRLIRTRLGMNLHARDCQNTLCEYSKFERGLEGQRLKRRYPGR
jgi:hypothetical protein